MRGKVIIFLSSSSFFLSYFSRVMWSIVAPFSSLKTTVTEDSTIFALFFLGYIIVQMPAGFLSDYIGVKFLLFSSLIGISFTSFISVYFPSIVVEYLTSFFMGFSAGWIYPITVKLISVTFSGKSLPIAMSIYSLAWPSSIIASGLIIPFLAIRFNWRSPFYLVSLISLFLAFLSLIYIPSIRVSGQKIFNIKSVISNKNSIFIAMGGFLFFLSYWILVLYLYKYLLNLVHDAYLAGLVYSFTALSGLFSTLLAGYIINFIGVKKTFLFFVSLYALSIISISFTSSIIIISISALLIGFFRFIITPAHSTALAIIGREKSGSLTGFSNFFWQSSGIFGSILAPILINLFSYTYLWLFVGILPLISLVFYLNIEFYNS
ncbi:MAG: MFS transporter [Saccharolobus sp.]|uniref:MFS transporter n=1 Tax=Saccharolobus sp. TaxID=2100761 RepID=UPI0028CEF8E4|nr:MFS transporter [Saccharolobus sp.]MDT7861791.1 MFS transporter [Saccharolobus sp.]